MRKRFSALLLALAVMGTALCTTACSQASPAPSAAPAAQTQPSAAPAEEPANEPTPMPDAHLSEMMQTALDELYDCGILAQRFEILPDSINYNGVVSEGTKLNSYNDRVLPLTHLLRAETADGDYIFLYIGDATGKAYYFSIGLQPAEGDAKLDREPLDMGAGPIDYYDSFSRIMREDMTLDELCAALCKYWGFSGYMISGTFYPDYNYDTEAPEGTELVKDMMDMPFVTVYFDGDQENMPMYFEGVYFPGNTSVSIGCSHAVG